MADPLSITASMLAVITATLQSTRSLCETVRRFQDRNKTLRRLVDELDDLIKILDSLKQVINTETAMLTLLEGPLDRCSQVCHQFEQLMKAFSNKSKTGFRDWTKMEFMRGDINEFIDTIAGYKSTISVGLGTITIHASKVSEHVLHEYNEMVKDTAYNLEIRLQQIDEKIARLTVESKGSPIMNIDLNDEREVTKQCLQICEDARTYMESLTTREPSLLHNAPRATAEEETPKLFEAQLLTRHALDGSRDDFTDVIFRLSKRLESIVANGDTESSRERLRLEEDIRVSKQCLEVCKVASEVSRQKTYRIGEVIAEGDSDQVVVTTLADLFDIKKALSKGSSAQLVGSMTDESLQHLAEKRYTSYFSAPAGNRTSAEGVTATSSRQFQRVQRSKHDVSTHANRGDQCPEPALKRNLPSSNEVRRRAMD